MGSVDQAVVIALHERAISLEWITMLVRVIAEYGIFVLPVALAAIWLVTGPGPTREAVLAGAIAFVLAILLSFALGLVIDRPRPFLALGTTPLFSYPVDSSFPSDHTLLGVATVGPTAWRSPRAGIWLVLWTLVVGLARVAAAVHYPSDIIGSALLAAVPTAMGLRAVPGFLARFPILRSIVGGAMPS